MENNNLKNIPMSDQTTQSDTERTNFGFASILNLLRRFWILIVIFTLIGGVVGVGLASLKNVTYYTQTKNVICIAKINDKNMLTNISLTNRLIETIKDQAITQPIVTTANKIYKAKGYSDTISAANIGLTVEKTLIFSFSYTDTNKSRARDKLDAYLDALQSEFEINGTTWTTGDEVTFKTIDNVPKTTSSNSFMKYLLISIFGGLALGVLLSVLLYLIDNTVSGKDELEALTGANVIAFIDDIRVEEKK